MQTKEETAEHVRAAREEDLVRIAETEVFNYRQFFYPVFRNDRFYFHELQTARLAEEYRGDLRELYVYDDGVIRGFMKICGKELQKLFVEPALQNQGVGTCLVRYAVSRHDVRFLWALEKNTGAIRFYRRHGFEPTAEKRLEEGTEEYLIRLERK